MLQFIVLGIIPGTNIQINFQQVLLMAALFVLVILLRIEIKRYFIKRQQRRATTLTLQAL